MHTLNDMNRLDFLIKCFKTIAARPRPIFEVVHRPRFICTNGVKQSMCGPVFSVIAFVELQHFARMMSRSVCVGQSSPVSLQHYCVIGSKYFSWHVNWCYTSACQAWMCIQIPCAYVCYISHTIIKSFSITMYDASWDFLIFKEGGQTPPAPPLFFFNHCPCGMMVS